MSNFKLKIKSTLWLPVGYSLELVVIKYLQALILSKSSTLYERMLISHVHSSEIMEWHNLGITTLETVIYAKKCFFKIVGKPNSYQSYWPNFITFCDNISHKLLRPSQFLEKSMEILKWPTCRNKSGHSTLLNVAGYWKSNNTDACAKRLSHVFAKDSENMGRGAGLRIFLRYSL